jgi:hypothetical protein
MSITSILTKLRVEHSNPVNYYLRAENEEVNFNKLIGSQISLTFSGEIFCLGCGQKTKKSFGQGYCFKCFSTSPENEECVLRPELCQAHLGIARDIEYAKEHCLKDHFVYLASSSEIKVGVTRMSQIPTRWIDQGASYAIKIAQTPNRFLAGQIEVALKNHFTDKTNWRAMLSNKIIIDPQFISSIEKIKAVLSHDLKQFLLENESPLAIQYPVNQYPVKVNSVSFDNLNEIGGILHGIKGQYLLLDGDRVLNIRKHGGYKVILNAKSQ